MARSRVPAPSALIVGLAAFGVGVAASAQATAFQITAPDQLIAGANAQGQMGDYLMANGLVRVIVADVASPPGIASMGGNIIDAATATGDDHFASLFTMFDDHFGRQGAYDSILIVNPGGGSQVAQIRVTGVDSEELALLVQTDYHLGPNDRHVRIVTRLANTGSAPIEQLQVGDAIQWRLTPSLASGRDGDGRNICGGGYDRGKTVVAWVGSDGLGTSYGYTTPSGLIELSNGSCWSNGNVAYLDLPAGRSGSYERDFIVGDGSMSTIADEVLHLRGSTSGGARAR